MNWGLWRVSGKRSVTVGGVEVGTTERCAGDDARLTIRRFVRREGEFATGDVGVNNNAHPSPDIALPASHGKTASK